MAGGEIQSVKLIAVDVSKFCKCHRLVLARRIDRPSWYYFHVKEPSWVEFGDRLVYYPETQHLFQDRGLLTYHSQLDLIPADIAIDLMAKLPYRDIYPNGTEFIVYEPPQG